MSRIVFAGLLLLPIFAQAQQALLVPPFFLTQESTSTVSYLLREAVKQGETATGVPVPSFEGFLQSTTTIDTNSDLVTAITPPTAETTDDPAAILKLLEQILALQTLLESLRSVQVAPPSSVQAPELPITPTSAFTRNLRYGMEGSDVRLLQEILAQDPELYPSQKITGYFGELTLKAVLAFQTRFNIASYGSPETTGFGLVGPQTQEALLAFRVGEIEAEDEIPQEELVTETTPGGETLDTTQVSPAETNDPVDSSLDPNLFDDLNI